jgi:hypothetical protein
MRFWCLLVVVGSDAFDGTTVVLSTARRRSMLLRGWLLLLWCFVWRLSEEETMRRMRVDAKGVLSTDRCYCTTARRRLSLLVARRVSVVGEEVLAPATATRGCRCCCCSVRLG